MMQYETGIQLLIVEDEPSFRQLLVNRLSRKGCSVTAADCGEAVAPLLKDQTFDIALVDIRLPAMDGLQVLHLIKTTQPEAEVLMITGHGSIETAIDAMRQGAYHYLTKPLDLKELEALIEKALEKRRLALRLTGYKTVLDRQAQDPEIIAQSQIMSVLLTTVLKAAGWDLPVLILGESGTGKELIAKALHRWGPRSGMPWVAINCGALPSALLESELFGHEKGAFSSAVSSRMGLAEAADQGTLFLDEIGELDLALQAKLLRFLESGEYRRLGSNRLQYANVRIVAATNHSLEEDVSKGSFRADLFYRLSGMILRVPPLREHPEDIPLLINHFLRRRYPEQPPAVSPAALDRLMQYQYPGNVRELAHLVDRACLLANANLLEWSHFIGMDPDSVSAKTPASTGADRRYPPGMPLEEVKRQHILATLQSCGGNKSVAAEKLGIGLRTLYRYLEEWGL